MKLDRSNYEIYLLDYLEGKLEENDRRQVERFLAANPDIADEMGQMQQDFFTEDDETIQIDKSGLFHNFNEVAKINPENFEEWCVAYYENELDKTAKLKLMAYLEIHPEQKALFEMHGKLHFDPEEEIEFPHIERLTRRKIIPIRRVLYIAASSAAAVAAIVLLFTTRPQDVSTTNSELSQHGTPAKPSQHELAEKAEAKNEPMGIKQTDSKVKIRPQVAVIDSSSTKTGPIIIAAISDSTSSRPEPVIMANVESIDPELNTQRANAAIPIPEIQDDELIKGDALAETKPDTHLEEPKTEKKFQLQRETMLVSALQAGVSGFNRLTESKVSVETGKNDKGKLTLIAINTENFELTRKTKKNIQN